jgi:hypothetical protein
MNYSKYESVISNLLRKDHSLSYLPDITFRAANDSARCHRSAMLVRMVS